MGKEPTVITVASAELDNYGNLNVVDMQGNKFRVNSKHDSLHPLFLPGVTIKLIWGNFKNKDYIDDAEVEQPPFEHIAQQPPPTRPESNEKPPEEMTKGDWADKDRIKRDSIEQQQAVDFAPALADAKAKHPDDILVKAAYNWAMSKLQNWSSQGEVPKPTEGSISVDQEKRINKICKDNKYGQTAVVALMMAKFDNPNIKALTSAQADTLVRSLENGEIESSNKLEGQ